MRFERVAIVVHDGKPGADAARDEIEGLLSSKGSVVDGDHPDLVVSLGGDGTMLRAAQLAHAHDAPLIGVNLGTLGYLTEVDAEHAAAALERVFAGDYTLEARMMLECRSRSEIHVGLNEVLIERSGRHRLVRLEVRVNGERLASFNADGVIVATPTGSTAYALSAGGPIVSPRAQCLVVVPVSAHMIFSRPFVLTPDDIVEVTVDESSGREASVAVDGTAGWDLPPGAVVEIRRHDRDLRLVRLAGPKFLARLRAKLDLPG